MKTPTLLALFAAAVLLCGCSSTPKFSEYHGSDVIQGKGGAVRSVDNIDFWDNGDPDRKYKILGFIEEGRGKKMPFGHISKMFSGSGENDSAVAKIAREKGGDAVIRIGGTPPPPRDDDLDFDTPHPRQARKMIVVKYVE